jgi:hypothetical protein
VPGSHDDVRAFVTVFRFRPAVVPGATERYRYLGRQQILYRARRFQVSREILGNDYDVSEEELWDSQSIVLPNEAALEFVLGLGLPDLETLVEPRLTDVPI